MSFNQGVVWLASYPKSGNTWFRIVLANVLNESNSAIHINRIGKGVSGSSRDLMNRALGCDSTLLSQEELDLLRPAIYAWYAEQSNTVRYFKTHNAYSHLSNHQPLHPSEGCSGAIYFIRNPLDVAISFAHHCNFSIDNAIKIMADKEYTTSPTNYGVTHYMPERYLSWTCHVQSWGSAKHIKRLMLRYEDMSLEPQATFKKAFDFLEIDVSEANLTQALEHAHIDKLQQQEQQFGFVEKSARQQGAFFRKGKVGDWKNTLSKAQIKRIIRDHGDTMYEYGYLDENFHPL